MGYKLSYDPLRMIATATPLGRFDLKTAVTMTEALVRDRRYQRGMGLLFDGTRLDLTPATSFAMRELAETLSKLAPLIGNPRVAIVGVSDLAFGLGRMIEACADLDVTIAIFRSREEARVWLAGFAAPGHDAAAPEPAS